MNETNERKCVQTVNVWGNPLTSCDPKWHVPPGAQASDFGDCDRARGCCLHHMPVYLPAESEPVAESPKVNLHDTMDAQVWARECCRLNPILVDEVREALNVWQQRCAHPEVFTERPLPALEYVAVTVAMNAAPQLLARLELLETVRRDAEAVHAWIAGHHIGHPCVSALRASLAAVEVTNG